MGILSWIIFGLIAGALAKFLMPGDDPGGMIVTTIIGIVGAVIGGFIAVQLGYGDISGFDFRSFMIAVIGGLVLLGAYRIIKRA
ncbi:MAG TPA: GlsB/YeaQ/YmgE family stress response membrane protein [Candidatus Binatia bacterium]|nr:GlsB/YeaQ/YmgE family stress response membrane protein [Candidatus Binatia bacterium]